VLVAGFWVMSTIMLDKKILTVVKQILFRYLDPKDYSTFIFGSRATGSDEPYSDIDIGIEGAPLSAKTLIELQEEFEESDLPFRVDIVDFSTVNDKFKQVAKQHIISLTFAGSA